MKMQLLMRTIFVIFIYLFSAKIFAQGLPDPGGDPLKSKERKTQIVKIVPFQLSPVFSYKKNNSAMGIVAVHFKMKVYYVPQNLVNFYVRKQPLKSGFHEQ
jgi:hypothetical protein